MFTNQELESYRLAELESEHAYGIRNHGVALGDVAHPGEQLQGKNSRLAKVGHDTN